MNANHPPRGSVNPNPSPGTGPDEAWKAEVQASIAQHEKQAMPARLREHLEADIDSRGSGGSPVVPFPSWLQDARSGWMVAAACFVLALFSWLRPVPDAPEPSTDPAPASPQSGSWVRVELDPGRDGFEAVSGRVEWNTTEQQGILYLTGLPANDPKEFQYQLWVVDPLRDPDYPIDSGVFDVPPQTGKGETVAIPFQPRLPVILPRAFAVTTEKPGGTVRSRNERPALVGFY